jgi:hypothetical protein
MFIDDILANISDENKCMPVKIIESKGMKKNG